MNRKTPRQLALLLAGAAILAALVWQAGPSHVAHELSKIGWAAFALLVGLSFLWNTIAALAWRLLFDRRHPTIGWKKLWHARICGESVNTLTPFLNLGGEPVKIVLLGRHLSEDQGTTYVLLDKTIFFLASLLYMASGLVLGFFVFRGHLLVLAVSGALLGLWIAALLYVVRRQTQGHTVLAVLDLLARLRIRVSPAFRERMQRVDADLAAFWKNHRTRFLSALAVHFAGRCVRAFDVWLIAGLLHSSIGLGSAYFISAAAVLVNTAFSFMANALGPYEGVHGYLFRLLGLEFDAGLSMGILRTIRTLTFAGLGYVLLVAIPSGRSVTAPPPNGQEAAP